MTISLSISGSFFSDIRTHLLRWRAELKRKANRPLVGQTDDPARQQLRQICNAATDSTVLVRVALA
jgi:hypothetical protein